MASLCVGTCTAGVARWGGGSSSGGMCSSPRTVGGRSNFMGILVVSNAQQRAASCSKTDSEMGNRRGGVTIVARSSNGGARPQPFRPARTMTGSRRGQNQQQVQDLNGGPVMNNDIRVPYVRVLDVEQNMLGVMPSVEALQRSRDADVDLVMISPDADPPVVRMMNYSKYRYEQQKKKREAQKKAAASRQVLKELKMRYNIDTHDYAVRQRAAQKFLTAGDKVKVVCQFKGRELDFKDLAVKLFQRFQEEIGPLAILETKIALEGKTMFMVLAPNKVAIQRAQSAAQSAKAKSAAGGKDDEKVQTSDPDDETSEETFETEQTLEESPAPV